MTNMPSVWFHGAQVSLNMTNILGVVILANCGQMDGRHLAISTLDRRVLKKYKS